MTTPRATDFFERQDRARRNTARLVLLFSVVLVFLTAGTYVAMALSVDILAMLAGIDPKWFIIPLTEPEQSVVRVDLGITAVVVTSLLVFGGGMWKTRSLRGGGAGVAEELGGTEVDSSDDDPRIRRYVNVVEEMALASGVPVPRTYVLEQEPAINAFAAGYTVNDAAIAVTWGALRQLNRDELQGVVAHEFSHILNGDIRLNIRLVGLLYGILSVFLAGKVLLDTGTVDDWGRQARQGGDDGAGILLAIPGVLLLAVGFVGAFCSRLIKSAVVRQREYLADAAAVQFTRNPEGLAGALKKIGGFSYGARLRGARAEMVSHMCFGDVARRSGLTHPPIEERIEAVDPSFDSELGFKVLDAETSRCGIDWDGPDGSTRALEGSDGSVMMEDQQSLAVALAMLEDTVDPDDVVETIGEISPQRLVYCASLLDEMPRLLMEARTSPLGAVTIVYLLLLDEDDEERRKQAEVIQQLAGASVSREARRLWPVVRQLPGELRLPLMDLVVPALRRMTEEQFEQFRQLADRLIEADGRVSFREFILEKLVIHHLERAFHDVDRRAVQFRSFSGVHRDIEHVLSALATAGTDDGSVIRRRFEQGRDHLPSVVRGEVQWRSPDRWDFENVGVSLERLSVAAPRIKEAVVQACAHCALADDEVVVQERQMLRAVCEMLDVPLPPMVAPET